MMVLLLGPKRMHGIWRTLNGLRSGSGEVGWFSMKTHLQKYLKKVLLCFNNKSLKKLKRARARCSAQHRNSHGGRQCGEPPAEVVSVNFYGERGHGVPIFMRRCPLLGAACPKWKVIHSGCRLLPLLGRGLPRDSALRFSPRLLGAAHHAY
ncbi:MAG: hypothetical protein [Cressdnaviricota sp.]|nr:MAG: hypothetical protein [Cressdnaviricota sp.]